MQGPLAKGLESLAALPGLVACALVDVATGMVLHLVGDPAQVEVAEAASDYWRLCQRQRAAFGGLGPARAQVLIHDKARLTLVACGSGLLLVTVSSEPDVVDWKHWKAGVGQLAHAAAGL